MPSPLLPAPTREGFCGWESESGVSEAGKDASGCVGRRAAAAVKRNNGRPRPRGGGGVELCRHVEGGVRAPHHESARAALARLSYRI